MIKKYIKKLVYGYKADQESYIEYLRKKGANIGKDVNLFGIRDCTIDILNPHLLEIGNHVNIVASTILTHDYAWSVIKGKIGNNIFIGEGSLILGGSIIEDNVIIGAHSVVSGYCEKDSIYAGNPAKKIMTLDQYIQKRRENQYKEAKVFIKMWKKQHGEIPDKTKLHEYFFLFENKVKKLPYEFNEKLKLNGNYQESKLMLEKHVPLFKTYEEFIKHCEEDFK